MGSIEYTMSTLSKPTTREEHFGIAGASDKKSHFVTPAPLLN